MAIPPSRAPWRVPIHGAVPKELGPSVIWNLHKLEDVQPDIKTKTNSSVRPYRRRRGVGPTRYATMELPRLARPEGCDYMTVYLCEGYGLGYLGLSLAGPGGLEHPLRRGLDTTSATGPYSARTAGTGNLRDPGRDRAAEHDGPPAAGPFGTWATGG